MYLYLYGFTTIVDHNHKSRKGVSEIHVSGSYLFCGPAVLVLTLGVDVADRHVQVLQTMIF